MWDKYLHFIWFIWLLVKCSEGANLSCTPDGAVEVIMGKTDNKVNCTNIGGASQSVFWKVPLSISTSYPAGTCLGDRGDSCTGETDAGFTPSRPSGDVSVMTIDGSKLTLIGRTLQCHANSIAVCSKLDIIYPAEATCRFAINTAGWTLSANCDITKVYSNSERYSCQFFTGMSNTSQPTEVQGKTNYTPSAHANPTYTTGSCGFNNINIPSDIGTHYYKALILPGYVSVVFGPLTVAAPSTPAINCSTQAGYVAENGQLQCTCSSDSVGQPAGRLMLVRHYNNLDLENITSGDYGKPSVQMTITVNRTLNGQRLRCDVDWIRRVNGSLVPINVTYGPDSLQVRGPLQPFETNGTTFMNLTCQPSPSNPPVLVYKWRHLPSMNDLGDQQNLSVKAARELDGQQIQCTASNGQFGGISAAG